MSCNHKTAASALCSQNDFFSSALSLAGLSCTSYVAKSCPARFTSAPLPKRDTTSNHIDLAIKSRRHIPRNSLFFSSGFTNLLFYGFSSPIPMSLRNYREFLSLQTIASQIRVRKHGEEASYTQFTQFISSTKR